uniref:ABC transporter domain-containing protein n=1 Tax=Rhabditophanes sp. KR3021 TaxID=114890 RepID=A0AC35U3I4_9BILA
MWFIYDPEILKRLYTCDALSDKEWRSYERPNLSVGLLYIITGILYEIMYVPVLLIIRQDEFQKNSAYIIMYALGRLDVTAIILGSLVTGTFAIMGVNMCPMGIYNYAMANFVLIGWYSGSTISLLLGVNRCMDVASSYYAEKMFGAAKNDPPTPSISSIIPINNPLAPQLTEEEFGVKLNEKYYNGRAIDIPIGQEATDDLHRHWSEQAISGLMAAFSSHKMHLMKKDAKTQLELCSKSAFNIKDHASCVRDALSSINKARKNHWTIFNGKSRKKLDLSVRRKRGNDTPLKVKKVDSYKIKSRFDSGLFSNMADVLKDTIRIVKNKNKTKSWRQVIYDVKKMGTDEIKRKEKEENDLRRFGNTIMNNMMQKAKDEQKTKDMTEKNIKMKDLRVPIDFLRNAVKLGISLSGGNTTDFEDKTLKLVSPRFLSLVPDQTGNDTLNLLSPSLFSLHEEGSKEESLFSVRKLLADLAPNDQDAWLDFIIEAAGVSDSIDIKEKHMKEEKEKKDRAMKGIHGENLFFTKENVTEMYGDEETSKIKVFEKLHQTYTKKQKDDMNKRGFSVLSKDQMALVYGIHGENLFFTKENVTEMYGDEETSKIKVFEKLHQTYTKKQKDDMNKRGFSLLSKDQMALVYGEDSPYNSSLTLKNLEHVNEHNIMELIEQTIHDISAGKLFSPYDIKAGARKKRDIVGSPFLLTPLTGVGVALSQPIILTPLVLSPITLSPAVLGPVTLSPTVFVPLILSPRVLSPLVLSPLVGVPIVLSPLVLHPFILSPGVMNPFVLSPFVLSPFILSPQVMTPVILSPFALSPLILTPMVLSPLILSPFILSPIIASPQWLFAVILSPYAMSPLIESKLTASEVILSPSWLS